MLHLTDSEWKVMGALWDGGPQTLGAVLARLAPDTGWSRTTVHTYLTRMITKGLVEARGQKPRHYAAVLSREAYAEQAGRTLLERAYGGSAGKLVASFIRSGALSPEERAQLKALLDEMEV